MAIGQVGEYPVGSLVRVRERDWVVLPSDDANIICLRPLSGSESTNTSACLRAGKAEGELQRYGASVDCSRAFAAHPAARVFVWHQQPAQVGEELRLHLAWRWFTRLGFDQDIPHHSTFSTKSGMA